MPKVELTLDISESVCNQAVKKIVEDTFTPPTIGWAKGHEGYVALREAVDKMVAATDFGAMVREEAARILPKIVEDCTRSALKGMVKEAIKEGYRDGSLVGVT